MYHKKITWHYHISFFRISEHPKISKTPWSQHLEMEEFDKELSLLPASAHSGSCTRPTWKSAAAAELWCCLCPPVQTHPCAKAAALDRQWFWACMHKVRGRSHKTLSSASHVHAAEAIWWIWPLFKALWKQMETWCLLTSFIPTLLTQMVFSHLWRIALLSYISNNRMQTILHYCWYNWSQAITAEASQCSTIFCSLPLSEQYSVSPFNPLLLKTNNRQEHTLKYQVSYLSIFPS